MTQVNFLRHGAFFGPEDANQNTFCIIGCGATGSWAAIMAAKMGWHNFQLWDADLVESHNLPNQAFDLEHVGIPKVDALESVLKRFNPAVQIEKHNYFFDATSQDHTDSLIDYVFIAVDSLDTRKQIYNSLILHPFVDLIFETRMGFVHSELNVLKTSDSKSINDLINMLKADSEVTEAACNERIISTLVTIVSSTLVHLLCAHASSKRTGNEFTSYGKTIFSLSPTLNTFSLK